MIKVIDYYRRANYGTEHEYIVPGQGKEAACIQLLTGQKTINKMIRGQISLLTDNAIQFNEVVQPNFLNIK